MTRTLHDNTPEALELLPPFLREDPQIQGTVDAVVRELARVEDSVDTLVENFFPHTADDYLHFWEELFGLAAGTKTVAQRRESVLAYIRGLKDTGYGSTWEEVVESLAGSDWIYADDHPDGLRGILWQRFDADGLGSGWLYDSGSAASWVEQSDGLQPIDLAQIQQYRDSKLVDQFVDVKFVQGTSALTLVGAMFKRLDNDDWLEFGTNISYGGVRLIKSDGGSISSLGSASYTLVPGDTYWLRVEISGNDVTGTLWDVDPNLRIGTALATVNHTLAGGDATKYGDTIEGDQGLRFYGGSGLDFRVANFRHGEGGYSIPDYTLRVTIPFDSGSGQAYELEKLLRVITPAAIDIEVFYDQGFILGSSTLGEEAL